MVSAPGKNCLQGIFFAAETEPADERRARPVCNSPLVPRKQISERLDLLAENEHARLARETHFLHLAIFADEQGIIAGLGAAIFPAALGFGNHLTAFLYRGLAAVDQQTVFAGSQLSFADLGGLGKLDGFGVGLVENS